VDARAVGAVFVARGPTRLGRARRHSGPRLAGGGVGAGTCGSRAGPWGDAGHLGRPVVDVAVAVALLCVLLACRGAFVSCRLRSTVGVALDVFSCCKSLAACLRCYCVV
jgi:hypothetical protein